MSALPSFQLNKHVLVSFLDPHEGGAGPSTWSYEIRRVSDAALINSDTLLYPANGNAVKVLLTSSYEVDEVYSVTVKNGAATTIHTWHFTVFSVDFGTVGAINTADINLKLRLAAGLLGRNAVFEYEEHEKGGIPTLTSVAVYDQNPQAEGAAVIGRFEMRKILDESFRVVGEVSARRPV